MVKREIPEGWESVGEIKYVGRYLKRALNREGIYRCEELGQVLNEFGAEWEDYREIRRRVKEWLEEILKNARGEGCCYPWKIVEGEERAYKARYTNERGYNGILKVMRHYAGELHKWVPCKYRGYSERRKYPRECRIEDM